MTEIRPNVLMLVGNFPHVNTGKGGHYYSTRVIYEALRRRVPVRLVVIGSEVPDALADLKQIALIRARGIVTPAAVRQVAAELQRHEANIVHCMDASSLLFARFATLATRTPVVWTKCGGRRLRRYTPRGSPDSVFHVEDMAYYRQMGHSPALISGRVRLPVISEGGARPTFPGAGAPIRMVRISRICTKYADGLVKTVHFAKALNAAGVTCTLDIIGHVEDPAVCRTLLSLAGEETQVRTSSDWTVQAAKRLPHYHVAVASGRAAMEALATGIPTFTTPTISEAPVLINGENFQPLMAANFSERGAVEASLAEAVATLKKFVECPENAVTYAQWCRDIRASYFDVDVARDRYIALYVDRLSAREPDNLWDLCRHWTSYHLGVALKARKSLSTARAKFLPETDL